MGGRTLLASFFVTRPTVIDMWISAVERHRGPSVVRIKVEQNPSPSFPMEGRIQDRLQHSEMGGDERHCYRSMMIGFCRYLWNLWGRPSPLFDIYSFNFEMYIYGVRV